jgi:hypothetical protein
MQTKLALVKLLLNYRLSPSEETRIPVTFVPTSIVQAPVGGMPLKLEKLVISN